MVSSVHPTVSISYLFLRLLLVSLLFLIVVASMRPRYVYKDMLDDLVSLITCVSMNH
jgi:hypothetical protein